MTQPNRKRALVVEDELMIGRVCQKVLTALGFEVDVAVNGLVAKEMVEKNHYDLCLSDIRTPGMNGMELYVYLEKEHHDLADRTIFTTGDVLSGNVNTFLEKTRKPFLPKPFTPDELKKVVQQALVHALPGTE